MDVVTLDLAIFLLATFAAALVAGLAGFAFGLVAAAAGLHVLTPPADRLLDVRELELDLSRPAVIALGRNWASLPSHAAERSSPRA